MSHNDLSTLSLNDFDCTQKAYDSIKNFSNDLSGRERQLLVCMTRSGSVCREASQRMLKKVSIHSLVSRGYLTCDDITKINDSPQTTDALATQTRDIEPALQWLAGYV